MANCKPCEEKGIAKTAFFVINGVPLCPEHRTEKLLGQVKKSVDEPTKEERKMSTLEEKAKKFEKIPSTAGLCHCGRPAGHRGIHRGGHINKKNAKIARAVKPAAVKRDLGGPVISVIADLEARVEKLQKLIAELKAL